MIKKVPRAKPFEPLSEEWIREKFGPLADGIIKENENDVLAAFDPQNIVDNWDAIREIVSNIPTAEEFADVFRGSTASTGSRTSASTRRSRRGAGHLRGHQKPPHLCADAQGAGL